MHLRLRDRAPERALVDLFLKAQPEVIRANTLKDSPHLLRGGPSRTSDVLASSMNTSPRSSSESATRPRYSPVSILSSVPEPRGVGGGGSASAAAAAAAAGLPESASPPPPELGAVWAGSAAGGSGGSGGSKRRSICSTAWGQSRKAKAEVTGQRQWNHRAKAVSQCLAGQRGCVHGRVLQGGWCR